MGVTAIFRRLGRAFLDWCDLQREMAEEATRLELQASGLVEERAPRDSQARDQAANRYQACAWTEWDKRYLS